MELIRDHGLPIDAMCGGACACATCHVHVAPEWAERLHPARDDEEAMLDTLPAAAATSRLSCQIIWDTHLDGLEVTLAGGQDPDAHEIFSRCLPISMAPTCWSPAAASRRRRRCGCCARPARASRVVAETVTGELRALGEQGAIRICLRAFAARDVDGQRLVYAATRRPRARCGRLAGGQGARHSRQRRRCAGAFHLHHAGHRRPCAGDGGDRHRGRRAGAGARDQDAASRRCCRPTSARSPSRAQALRQRVAEAVSDGRARRRLWERLLQGPFRRAVLSGASGEADRILAAELAGRGRGRRRAAWR